MRWEEQRKAMQQDAYQKQEVAKYQDQLARQRMEAEHEKQRVRNIELVRLQVRPSVPGSLLLLSTHYTPAARITLCCG